jgi:hypothetical protein
MERSKKGRERDLDAEGLEDLDLLTLSQVWEVHLHQKL